MQWVPNPGAEDVRIGVVGPRELVGRILLLGADAESGGWRLVGSSHVEERETYEKLLQIADRVDVVLFTGPLQYDLAREAGEIPVPGTFVPVKGASLYSSLIRGIVDQTIDPTKLSVDSISALDVAEAYADIGISAEHVHSVAYEGPQSVRGFAAFHRKLYETGTTSAALTTVQSVAQQLRSDHVPVLRMLPPSNTIRMALNTAALLGAGSKLEESQIVILAVEVSESSRPARRGASNYWHEEMMLSLHQRLLSEIRGVGATMVPRDADTFLITATRGSLSALTNNLQQAPFLSRIRIETGLSVDVGIGLGATARDAEEHAFRALEHSRRGSSIAYLMGPGNKLLSLPAQLKRSNPSTVAVTRTKASASAQRISDLLGTDGHGPVVVDAERVATALGVTSRSARRLLTALVESGEAWPMPALTSPKGGRPRQQFRLVARS